MHGRCVNKAMVLPGTHMAAVLPMCMVIIVTVGTTEELTMVGVGDFTCAIELCEV